MKLKIIRFRKTEPITPVKILVVREKRGGGRIVTREPRKPEPVQKVLHFDGAIPIETDEAKKFEAIKDGDHICDYKNVQVKGYLSTFQGTTAADRDGDYVIPGAFKDTIPTFLQKNPVMLKDHRNNTASIAGKFTVVREDKKGLYVEATLSNAPGNIDARFMVAEGILKTLSMGGLFHYGSDGRAIEKVTLWEGSLVAIPANPDAIINLRELTTEEHVKFIKQFALAA